MRARVGSGVLAAVAMVVLVHGSAAAQVSIGEAGAPVTQDFDGLGRTAPSDVMPTGWSFVESGTNANTTYGISTGGASEGNTYSFGANNGTDRALGAIASGNVESTFGGRFANATGAAITSLGVSYYGEWWRVGGAASDALVFEYSLNATSLTTGTWVAVADLAFSNLDVPCAVAGNCAAGDVKDGNLPAHRSLRQARISGLSIANGAQFWFRWRDTNPAGSDHGLAVDDFSVTANPAAVDEPIVTLEKAVSVVSGAALPGAALEYNFMVAVEDESSQGIEGFVLTDVLPDTVTAIIDAGATNFAFSIEVDSVTNLTAAADGDAGEIVGNTVTVRLPELEVGGVAMITFRVTIDPTTTAFTLANVGSATYDGAVAGLDFEIDSNDALLEVDACDGANDCDDDDVCTTDACTNGSCVATNNTLACDDTLATTHSDTCAGGTCVGTTIVCAAPNQCQDAGVPNGSATCAPTPKPDTALCDDGNANTVNDRCDGNGACVGTSSECPDAPPACNTYVFNGVSCVLTPTTGACDDGLANTRNDTCVGGACNGTAFTCVAGQCDQSSVPNGVDCTVTPKTPGASCDDNNPCTEDDICGGGLCAGVGFCDGGETCVAGNCESTHCQACTDSAECGRDSECLAYGGADVCLLVCADDNDCANGQVCRDFEGERRCFDASGPCAAPDVDPEANPEVGPEVSEPTPDENPESNPEVTEPDENPESNPEVTEPDENPEVTEPDENPEVTEPDEDPESDVETSPEISPEQSAETTPDLNPETTPADQATEMTTEMVIEITESSGAETKEKVEGGCSNGASPSLLGLALMALALTRRRRV